MGDFGDVRSACHARDLRALIEVAYVNGRYTLRDVGTSYVQAVLPEYEHEVWVWARAMVERLLGVTNVPLEMVRGFAATWAEWMLAGADGGMPVYIDGLDQNSSYYKGVCGAYYHGGKGGMYAEHQLAIEFDEQLNPPAWRVHWTYGAG